jgi:ATP-binding cassette, subfamily A (ABC1), member 3
MNHIRQKVGVCLQMNVLYDSLTVIEHLKFYGRLKGYRQEDLDEKVEEIM